MSLHEVIKSEEWINLLVYEDDKLQHESDVNRLEVVAAAAIVRTSRIGGLGGVRWAKITI